MDNNRFAIPLFIYLLEAYATIGHFIKLDKLQRLSSQCPSFNVFHSNLKDSSQLIKIMNDVSSAAKVDCGVSQGSTVGPTLFNIYVNELRILPLLSKIYQYVDETGLVLPYALLRR